MGSLPTTKNGHSYIFTIQDLLIKNLPSDSIGTNDGLVAVICSRSLRISYALSVDLSQKILTDQRTNFISSLMKCVARRFRIKQCHTIAYRPQSNGLIERSRPLGIHEAIRKEG